MVRCPPKKSCVRKWLGGVLLQISSWSILAARKVTCSLREGTMSGARLQSGLQRPRMPKVTSMILPSRYTKFPDHSLFSARWIKFTNAAKPAEAKEIAGFEAASYGLNSRGQAKRARKYLGWNPTAPSLKEEVPNIVDVEAELLGLKPSKPWAWACFAFGLASRPNYSPMKHFDNGGCTCGSAQVVSALIFTRGQSFWLKWRQRYAWWIIAVPWLRILSEHICVNFVPYAAIIARHKRQPWQSFYHLIVLFIYHTGLPGGHKLFIWRAATKKYRPAKVDCSQSCNVVSVAI
jgi:hypothetical protein